MRTLIEGQLEFDFDACVDGPDLLDDAPTPVATLAGTVPIAVLALVGLEPEVKDEVAKMAAIRFGTRVEIDLEVADMVAPGSADVLEAYWRASRRLWDALAAGAPSEVPAVLVRRTVLTARQTDTKTERHDLSDELFALTGHPQLALACNILDTNPDWKALEDLGTLTMASDRARLEVAVSGQHLPASLGGPRSRSEVARHIVLEASHAAWRDRRIRRLMSITVTVDEVWPDPAAC